MWKLKSVQKLNGLLELHLTNEEKVINDFHLPMTTNHDDKIEVVGFLASKDDYINQITLICRTRKYSTGSEN